MFENQILTNMNLQERFGGVTRFLFPLRCLHCETKIEMDYLCEKCTRAMDTFSSPNHARETMYHHIKQTHIIPLFDDAVSLYLFHKDGIFQSLISSFKYRRVKGIGTLLGEALGKFIKEEVAKISIDFISSIPIHPIKKFTRRYNQSEVVGRAVSTFIHLPYKECLKRIRYTESQTKLSKKERMFPTKEIFKRTASVEGKNIILIDDIFTTGSTINHASKILKEGNANKIYIATVSTTI